MLPNSCTSHPVAHHRAPAMASGNAGQGTLLPGHAPRSDVEGWSTVPISPGAPTPHALAVNAGDAPHERGSTRTRRILVAGGILLAVVLVVAAVVLASGSGAGKPINAQTLDSGPYSIRFLAVGDWGRGPGQEGHDNQTAVSQLMDKVASAQPVEFIVSTGDNFYPNGLVSYNDSAFTDTFTKAYAAKSLQVPWHAVLGNHDYCDSAPGCNTTAGCPNSPLHQLNMSLTNLDPRWHCERAYTHKAAGGRVELFFLDTSPFIQRYYNNSGAEEDDENKDISWRLCPGGLMQQSWQAQLLELERRLNASTAEWKLAVGHHPTHSNGEHGNNTDIIRHVEPLLLRYNVAAYFVGHDHNLELLSVPAPDGSGRSYTVVVTGAGSKTQRPQIGTTYSQYYYPYSGFVGATVTQDTLSLDYYTLEGGSKAAFSTTIQRPAAS